MKNKRFSFVAAFCLMLFLLAGTAGAAGNACGEHLTWACTEDGVLTVSGTGEMWSYALQGVPWDRNRIREVVIEEGVTSIGDSAFHSCANLTSVQIADSVASIGSNAFFASGLTSVRIPNTVRETGSYAFANCAALTSVEGADVGGGKEGVAFADGVFSGCRSLTRVSIPEGMTEFSGSHMFRGCAALTAVALPRSLTKLSAALFSDCAALRDLYFAGDVLPELDRFLPAGYVDRLDEIAFHLNSGLPAVTAPKTLAAVPTASTVLVNGSETAFDAYNIEGANYFKLRDLAYALRGTAKQFEVAWDAPTKTINLVPGQAYTAAGGEMSGAGEGEKTAVPTAARILLDGKAVSFAAYNIGGNNYFKLRDIGQAMNFGVDWDSTKRTIAIDTSKAYTPEA